MSDGQRKHATSQHLCTKHVCTATLWYTGSWYRLSYKFYSLPGRGVSTNCFIWGELGICLQSCEDSCRFFLHYCVYAGNNSGRSVSQSVSLLFWWFPSILAVAAAATAFLSVLRVGWKERDRLNQLTPWALQGINAWDRYTRALTEQVPLAYSAVHAVKYENA